MFLMCPVSYEDQMVPPLCCDKIPSVPAWLSVKLFISKVTVQLKGGKMQLSGYCGTASGVTSHLPQIFIHNSSQEVHVWYKGKIVLLSGCVSDCP